MCVSNWCDLQTSTTRRPWPCLAVVLNTLLYSWGLGSSFGPASDCPYLTAVSSVLSPYPTSGDVIQLCVSRNIMRQVMKRTKGREIWGYSSVVAEDSSFVRCYAASSRIAALRDLKTPRIIGTSGITCRGEKSYVREDMNLESTRRWKVLEELPAQFTGVVAITAAMW